MIELSYYADPATRKQAYDIVCRLLENPKSVKRVELESLLLYFAPKLGRRPRSAYEWVSMATGKDDSRRYLMVVHCEEGWIMATDGHRFHLAPCSDLEEGAYHPGVEPIKVKGEVRKLPWKEIGLPVDESKFSPFDASLKLSRRLLRQPKWLGGDVWLVRTPDGKYVKETYWIEAVAADADGIYFGEKFVALRTKYGQAAIAYFSVPEGWEDNEQ